jgi:DNA-binding beta-propeller fold protein YncE
MSVDGLAVDASGFVYVADPSQGRIRKYTNTGTFVLEWSAFIGQPSRTVRLAPDPSGTLYVVDNDGARVLMFTSTGAFIAQWGSSGSANGQFLNPIGIAVDASYNVYVCDTNSSRIQKFGPQVVAASALTLGRLRSLYR